MWGVFWVRALIFLTNPALLILNLFLGGLKKSNFFPGGMVSLPSVSLDIPDKPGISITHHIWGTEDKAHDAKGTVMIHFVGFCLFFVKLYSMIW